MLRDNGSSLPNSELVGEKLKNPNSSEFPAPILEVTPEVLETLAPFFFRALWGL